jgi:uncharacterized iron-regulated protein
MYQALSIGLFALICSNVVAVAGENELLDGTSLSPISIEAILQNVEKGSVLIISEQHDSAAHHQNQIQFLEKMSELKVSVGLEFFEWPYQGDVDRYVSGQLAENEFLAKIGWGALSFDFYRAQALFGPAHGGFTVAINAPRSLTGRISKVGLSGLNEAERDLLPLNFQLGNQKYFERFEDVMAGHVSPEALLRYFEAQSVWDDTMANQSARFLATHPEQRLVILVGDFHAQYGGGLPDRLRARNVRVKVISQVPVSGMSEVERQAALGVHPKWGARAEYVWATP